MHFSEVRESHSKDEAVRADKTKPTQNRHEPCAAIDRVETFKAEPHFITVADREAVGVTFWKFQCEPGSLTIFSDGQLTRALGKPQAFVSYYESGTRRLDLLELRQICEILGIPLLEFVRKFEQLLQ